MPELRKLVPAYISNLRRYFVECRTPNKECRMTKLGVMSEAPGALRAG